MLGQSLGSSPLLTLMSCATLGEVQGPLGSEQKVKGWEGDMQENRSSLETCDHRHSNCHIVVTLR